MDVPDPAFTTQRSLDLDIPLEDRSPTADLEKDSMEESGTPEKAPPPRDVHGWKWSIVVSSILASTFLFSLDNTIVADVQPAVFQRFGEIDTLPVSHATILLALLLPNLAFQTASDTSSGGPATSNGLSEFFVHSTILTSELTVVARCRLRSGIGRHHSSMVQSLRCLQR